MSKKQVIPTSCQTLVVFQEVLFLPAFACLMILFPGVEFRVGQLKGLHRFYHGRDRLDFLGRTRCIVIRDLDLDFGPFRALKQFIEFDSTALHDSFPG